VGFAEWASRINNVVFSCASRVLIRWLTAADVKFWLRAADAIDPEFITAIRLSKKRISKTIYFPEQNY